MWNTFARTISLLSSRERRSGAWLLILVVVMAIFETFGIAALLPFFKFMSKPAEIDTNVHAAALYAWGGFGSHHNFLMALGLFAFGMIVVAAAIRIVTTLLMNRYAQVGGHNMAMRLLETYLRQPYVFFLNRHSSDLSKKILSDSVMLVTTVLQPGMYVFAYSVVVILMTTLMLLLDPMIAVLVGGVIGGLYVLIFKLIKGRMSHIGKDLDAAVQERFAAIDVAFGGIKDIKLLGSEKVYLDQFRPASIRYAKHLATNNTLSETPRYLIEAVAIGGALALALILLTTSHGAGLVLPGLSVYALAGYKLIPAAQRVYNGLGNLRFGDATLSSIQNDMIPTEHGNELEGGNKAPLVPRQEILIDNVGFTYPAAQRRALENISLAIKPGNTIGLIGGTGAGKTTLVDIILGLLEPTEGSLKIDGVAITPANLRQWQLALGYVPQAIFLADTSVAENIALGVDKAAIDLAKVEECARMAQIHEYIAAEMPDGYHTRVGERGVRLSGGQRQRIGIARALYRDPAVLVLDEATSALDTVTERAVMESVHALSGQKIIIMIAHRLSTVRDCDMIFMLDHGQLIEQGTYDELLTRSEKFALMV